MAWYAPALAMIYVIRDKEDVVFILKIICRVRGIQYGGRTGFVLPPASIFLDIFPLGMLAALIQTNPALHALLPAPEDFRNGMYRSPSTFLSQLSFGEFEIIAIPIGLFFAAHRKDVYERTLGWVVVVGGILGIFSSGSRGGWVGVIPTVAVFVAFWSIRKAVSHRGSLGPAIAGLAGAISLVAVIGLIIVWPKAHNIVLGGGAEAGSTEARYIQWVIATPFIKSNPITGHGFVLGGYIINGSIDSYVISLLIETGIPGFVFFTGMLLLPIWYGLRNYLADLSETGAVAGALACSFIAFTINRLVLSEREPHVDLFSARDRRLSELRVREKASCPATNLEARGQVAHAKLWAGWRAGDALDVLIARATPRLPLHAGHEIGPSPRYGFNATASRLSRKL